MAFSKHSSHSAKIGMESFMYFYSLTRKVQSRMSDYVPILMRRIELLGSTEASRKRKAIRSKKPHLRSNGKAWEKTMVFPEFLDA